MNKSQQVKLKTLLLNRQKLDSITLTTEAKFYSHLLTSLQAFPFNNIIKIPVNGQWKKNKNKINHLFTVRFY